ncbi:MAG: hypothetical protein LN414_05820 [Candidatus Thermoplasmatota archaeon]|nr:hypothetical protein [Candidatus Thermoplasmatota archaeon]
MAKKVRKDGERKEEKKVVFEPPEFDEREYLTEQLHNIRSTLFFIILAIPMGLAWAFTSIATGTNVAGLAVSVTGYILGTQVLRLVFDVNLMEGSKRTLVVTFLMFLFTSLAFSVVMSNPPVNDVTAPSITDVVVTIQGNGTDETDWTILMRHRRTLPLNRSNDKRIDDNPKQRLFLVEEGTNAISGDTVNILVRAGDAAGTESVILTYGYTAINSAPVRMDRVSESLWNELDIGMDYYLWGEHYYNYKIQNAAPGNLYFNITVTDVNGHTRVFETKTSAESVQIINE